MEKYEIGRLYDVPCALVPSGLRRVAGGGSRLTDVAIVPVLGPQHEDQAFIGFGKQHYHPDFRFMSNLAIADYLGQPPNEITPYTISSGMLCVIVDIVGDVVTRRKKYQREMPVARPLSAVWLPSLTEAFREAVIDLENPVCPHRGLPLCAPPDEDGVTVCPGHALRWNLNTGRIVDVSMRTLLSR